MATTTASFTLTSTDLMANALNLSNTATLTTAGTTTGITETTGLARKKLASASLTDLITVANTDVTAAKSAKVYIKNHNDRGDGTKYVNILLAALEIGRLYGGDWLFIPCCSADGKDIECTPSDATATTLEYTCFDE